MVCEAGLYAYTIFIECVILIFFAVFSLVFRKFRSILLSILVIMGLIAGFSPLLMAISKGLFC